MQRIAFSAFLFLGTLTAAKNPASLPHFDGNSWWHNIEVLANDNMEGRDTGSPGLARAQEYVVSQLKEAGLQPAGDNGFYQPVKLESQKLDESASSAALIYKLHLCLSATGFTCPKLIMTTWPVLI